jgi:hypothetical protein
MFIIHLKLDARFLLLLSFLLKVVRYIVITYNGYIDVVSSILFYFWILTLLFFIDSTKKFVISY